MKTTTLLASITMTTIVMVFSGCGGSQEETKKPVPLPSIKVKSLDIVNNGLEISWKVSVNNSEKDVHIKVGPWNDTTYYFSALSHNYADSIALSCNTQVNGSYLDCNKVDEIHCDRVLIGSDYSDYRCDLLVKGVTYPQYAGEMRAATMSNTSPSQEVLLSVATQHWYENSSGYEKNKYLYEKDTSKMFNVFSGTVGP